MPKISVIIPVYKAERYLLRCFKSITRQTFQDFEVILIDDGSPDKSGNICDEYCKEDNRFKVIHTPNQGVSCARQLGIDNAKGDYSIHIDPDDWIEQDMFALMYEEAIVKDADMVICDFVKEFGDSSEICRHENYDNRDLLEAFLCDYPGSCWNKLIRHCLYKEYDVSFVPGLQRWEDLHVICSFFLHPLKAIFLERPLYHYDLHTNTNSLVRFATIEGVSSQIYVCDFFYKILKDTKYQKAVDNMRLATKNLSYTIYNAKDFIKLYDDLNKKMIKDGLLFRLGYSGIFYAFTIITNSNFPQSIYKKCLFSRKKGSANSLFKVFEID